MASEFTVSGSLSYLDSENTLAFLQQVGFTDSITTKQFVHNKQNIGTTEEAIKLGELATIGWAFFKNLGSTVCEIRTGTGGTKIITLRAGGLALFYFGSGVTAPYAISTSSANQVEYVIFAT
jgi:hypothetical protein